MKITASEIEHVANLARLSLDSDEIQDLSRQLNDILGYIGKLQELDTGKVRPTTHALELTNVFREDRSRPSLPVDEALSNAPEHENGVFVVPKII
ncbi:MAG: Asp-tRNA(Asn)/Glu-tRNA(Gln) amidotransferase subunit GatC [Nitrospiraceae bacterium]|nr:Asp-tRNA(Asn)/Glu-tRNA(Gln) amidotransferase subunit GatC [Nitrospiraceae bacterium]